MKRIIATIALAFATVCAFAQVSNLLRPRVEIAEVTAKETTTDIEVFYMNDESPRMYYLSLGGLGIGSDIIQVDFDPVFELFIPLGNTLEEAIAKMEEIKAFYKMPRRQKTEIQACFAVAYPNENLIPVTVTSRRFLGSKVLEFSIPTDTEGLVRATHIYRSNFRSLLGSVKVYKKLHPKE